MVRREGQAELSSLHAQGLPMGNKQHDMTRYWQYCVDRTIHAHLHAWKWVKVPKLAQMAKLKLAVDGSRVRREGQAELSSHHAQGLPMGHKQHDMTRYWQYCVGQTIHAHLHAWKWVKVPKLAQMAKLKLAVDGKEGRAGRIIFPSCPRPPYGS